MITLQNNTKPPYVTYSMSVNHLPYLYNSHVDKQTGAPAHEAVLTAEGQAAGNDSQRVPWRAEGLQT